MTQQKITFFIKSTCIFVFALGCMVLLGWLLNIPLLTSIIPGYANMKANTSILFILSSIELYRIAYKKWSFLNKILCFFIALIGLATLIQYEFQLNFSIDEFFVKDFLYNQDIDSYPGRMARGTSLSFCLLGISFCLVKGTRERSRKIAQYLLHTISLISFLAIIGYLLGVPVFYKLSSIGSMAIHTAFGFLILSIATSFLNSNLGITGLLTGNKIGNRMARQLFPTLTLSVIFLSIIRIYLHRYSLVSVEFGIGIFATSFILIGLLLISISARQLNRINYVKTQAEEKLEALNKNLEHTILQRTNELRKKEQLLNAIINNTSSAIFVKDISGDYILVNKKFASDFGLEPESMIGKNAYDIFPKETADQ